MPKKKQQEKASAAPKSKLRTAAEVINRLKWSYNDQDDDGLGDRPPNAENTVMGYDCRINGPLEKYVKDYNKIAGEEVKSQNIVGGDDGASEHTVKYGDIPEHRIQYFRRVINNNDDNDSTLLANSFLWDRSSRLDKLFSSGEGPDAPLNPTTLQNARQALLTEKRLAEERAIFAEEKAKRRARQQAAKALAAKKLNAAMSPTTSILTTNERPTNERHTWYPIKQIYVCDDDANDTTSNKEENPQWTGHDVVSKHNVVLRSNKDDITTSDDALTFVTWNVLFDLQRNDQNELIHGDNSLLGDGDDTLLRWKNLLDLLSNEGADVIALQEVTPRFLELILSQEWVQQSYCSSEATSSVSSSLSDHHPETLHPYGNLTLWKRNSFQCNGFYLCRDVHRNRATIASLRHHRVGKLNIANVHLPADKHNMEDGTTHDRTIARRKELGAVLAKLQILEQQQKLNGPLSIPLILGDFNSGDDDPDLFQTNVFVDSWLYCHGDAGGGSCGGGDDDDKGFTFDWTVNKRADKTRQHGHSERPPRRIDRIFIGKSPGDEFAMVPFTARLVGRNEGDDFPPSDHYGVATSFSFSHSDHQSRKAQQKTILYDNVNGGYNNWAASANPTTESLLALVLQDDSPNVKGTLLSDSSSTLPIPHVTILNGFVDLTSDEKIQLASQAVSDAIRQGLDSRNPSKTWSLPINASSLSLFEHRASATMVCLPDTSDEDNGSWLIRLYKTLRAIFPLCHEQESRFAGGWTPHLSLSSYPDAANARDAMNGIRANRRWVTEDDPPFGIRVYGVGLFRRDVNDGKFYPVTTIPLARSRHKEVRLSDTKGFLQCAGKAWSDSSMGASSLILQELERACDYANQKLNNRQLEATVRSFGSYDLGVSLPGISDLDTVVILKPRTADAENVVRIMSDQQFLGCISARISALHKGAKSRMRLSSSPTGTALYLLTIKISPQSPSVDVLLCRVDASGEPINAVGQTAIGAISDSGFIHSAVREMDFFSSGNPSSFDGWQVYQGALRIIKLWAVRRQIYGTAMGYLGGGGWALLLLWVLQRGNRENSRIEATELSLAAQELVSYFFESVTRLYANSNHVVTVSTDLDEDLVERAAGIASSRGSMSVLAPVSGGDFGRSTTTSTTSTLWEEIRLARQRSGNIEGMVTTPYDIASSSTAVLALQVDVPGNSKPSDVKARGATKALNLTVELGGEMSLRLSSRALKKENSFFYFWGISGTSGSIDGVVSEHAALLEEECNSSFSPVKAKLMKLTCKEYNERFGVRTRARSISPFHK